MADDIAPPSQALQDFANGAEPTAPVVAQQAQPGLPPPSNKLAQFAHEQDIHDKYGSVPQVALAGAEGLARGLTLGGSDLAETRLGLSTPEAIRGRQEESPIVSGGMNMLGGAGLVGLTGGLAAPIEGALAGGALNSLAAKAIGYGAEGAVFGAGNALSDYSLGDPNLNAEKVWSDVGMGALFGAGLGAAARGLEKVGLIPERLGAVADQANSAAETSEALTGSRGAPSDTGGIGGSGDGENGQITKALNSDKANAPELRASAQRLGIDLTPGMTSADKWIQRAEDAVGNSAPTYVGLAQEAERTNIFNTALNTVNNVLDTGETFGGGAMTKAQLGESLKGSITGKIAEESAPIEAMYEQLKPHMQEIPVPKNAAPSIAREILDMSEAKTSFPEATMARNVAKDILNLDSVDDVKNYKSALNRSISSTASPGEKHMVGVLSDKLTGLEENSILKAASDPSLPPETQDAMKGLIEQRKQANAAYAPFRKNLNELTEQLGKKNAGGPGTAINFIKNELDPETLANKLFDKKYSGFNKFFEKNFPEESALMRQYQKQVLKDGASKTGEFSPKVFFNNLNKFEPEIKASIFHPDELRDIKDAENIIRALPKDFNPSGTAGKSAFLEFFESPAKAVVANARDFGIKAFIKARAAMLDRGNPYQFGAEMGDKLNKFTAVQKMAQAADQKISSGSKSIFRAGDAIRGGILAGGTDAIDKEFNKASKGVKNLSDNPAGLMDHLDHHVGAGTTAALPNVSQSLNNKAVAGLSFLNSKLPKPAQNLPMSPDYAPSAAEKAKFVRYYNAVNNPIGVLDQVKHGMVSSEAVEALAAVHPQLLQQMRNQVAGEMKKADPAKVPYSVKLSVAKFLGTPLDSSMQPQVIQSNQISLASPQLGQQQAAPTGKRGRMSKFAGGANRVATETRDTEDDKD